MEGVPGELEKLIDEEQRKVDKKNIKVQFQFYEQDQSECTN